MADCSCTEFVKVPEDCSMLVIIVFITDAFPLKFPDVVLNDAEGTNHLSLLTMQSAN